MSSGEETEDETRANESSESYEAEEAELAAAEEEEEEANANTKTRRSARLSKKVNKEKNNSSESDVEIIKKTAEESSEEKENGAAEEETSKNTKSKKSTRTRARKRTKAESAADDEEEGKDEGGGEGEEGEEGEKKKKKISTLDSLPLEVDEPPKKKRRVSAKDKEASADKTIGTSSGESGSKATKNTKSTDKKTKMKGSEAQDMVEKYMKQQNRPYNAKSISENLHGAVTKAAVEKYCQALVEKGTLCCKKFGKSQNVLIFWYNQNLITNNNSETNDNADNNTNTNTAEDIAQLQKRLKELKMKYTELQNEYKTVTITPSDTQLQEQWLNKKKEFDRLDTLLKEKSEVDPQDTKPKISEQEVTDVKLQFYKYANAWKERKQVCHDMIEDIWSDKKIKDVIHNKINGACDEDSGDTWDKYKDMFKAASLFYLKHTKPVLKSKTALNSTKKTPINKTKKIISNDEDDNGGEIED